MYSIQKWGQVSQIDFPCFLTDKVEAALWICIQIKHSQSQLYTDF